MTQALTAPPRGVEIRTLHGFLSEVCDVVAFARSTISRCSERGMGMCASAGRPYGLQVWCRDAASATELMSECRLGMMETLDTILSHQRDDGCLPHRVEWTRHSLGYILPWDRIIMRRHGHPVYAGSFMAVSPRDTVSAFIVACGGIFRHVNDGCRFIEERWGQLCDAYAYEVEHVDPRDGLIIGGEFQDWNDAATGRTGKLAGVNLLWYQASREMAYMARCLGKLEESAYYRTRARRTLRGLMKLWHDDGGYFMSGEGDDRFDTFANVIACLFLPSVSRLMRIQAALERRARLSHGLLATVDPLYPKWRASWRTGYIWQSGNSHVYPWLATLNILSQVRIANLSEDSAVKQEFLQRAMDNFLQITRLHRDSESLHEVYDRCLDGFRPAAHRRLVWWFRSNPEFLGAATTYLSAYKALQLSLLPSE